MSEFSDWDVIVIGGGPAGMMAAGQAAARGRRVLLLEKNTILGKKLLITGGGRCNITNNRPEVRNMLAKYKQSDKFLYSTFSQFGVTDALNFFNGRGLETKVEAEGRVFPASNKAQSVRDLLVNYLVETGVGVRTGCAVQSVAQNKNSQQILIKLKTGEILITRTCILATGGLSRPETGSTGEGFGWLKALGHKVIDNNFALVPIALADDWVKKIGGVTLGDIKLTTFQNNKKQAVYKGKLLFTHFGVSGPTVMNMSRDVGELLNYGGVVIALDLLPQFDHGQLKVELQKLLIAQSNKKLKNTLGALIPSSLISGLLPLIGVDLETPNHSVRSAERVKIVGLLKSVPLNVKGLLGADKAVVSSGGVDLKEVDFKTMESRLISGLYLVGDVLNIDRPSGGYSLQLCWTTGFVAGNSC